MGHITANESLFSWSVCETLSLNVNFSLLQRSDTPQLKLKQASCVHTYVHTRTAVSTGLQGRAESHSESHSEEDHCGIKHLCMLYCTALKTTHLPRSSPIS